MKIVDTFPKMADCFIDGVFNMERWEIYANLISPKLAIKLKNDIADFDFQKDILPLLNNVTCHFDKLNTAHKSFLALTNGLSEKTQDILQTDLNVTVIFYLGLCNAAGWATELDGKPVVLLGAEKIMELSWHNISDMAGLIYHELGHIWHDKMRSKKSKPFKNRALWQLYREGIAMFVEQLLMNDRDFYHQNKDGWLIWCRAKQKELFQTFLERVITSENTGDFFGDWNSYQGKSDTGYYLGCEIVKDFSKKYSLTQLADLSENEFLCQLQKTGN